jgi:hypothetical protein
VPSNASIVATIGRSDQCLEVWISAYLLPHAQHELVGDLLAERLQCLGGHTRLFSLAYELLPEAPAAPVACYRYWMDLDRLIGTIEEDVGQ